MSLPEQWIDRIFSKMTLTYGSAWLRMWEGVDINAVKANWAEELSGFQQKPNAIRHGLENLPPSKPPTVIEFRDTCRRAPEPAHLALAQPVANPEKVNAIVRQLRSKFLGGRS